jgi:hypothetical protein
MTVATPDRQGATASRTAFLDEAEAFARARRQALPFRCLKWFTRCSEDELGFLIRKIYCESLPEGGACAEGWWLAGLKSLVQPASYLLRKTVLWNPRPAVVFDLETITPPYFERWFASAFERLDGPKRLTSRCDPQAFVGKAEARIDSTVTPATALKLLLAPLCIPALWAMSPAANSPKFLAAFRQALGFYAVFEGHFRRYPCRHFLTFSDETNHPSRYIAFKQNCGGSLVVVQNGERNRHPMHAFGMVDVYLTFGEFQRRLCADLRMHVGRVVPVGALCLNEYHPLLQTLERESAGRQVYDQDLVFVDQSLWPDNGLDQAAGEGFFKVFRNLDRLKAERPSLRLAYQLKCYSDRDERDRIVAAVRRSIPSGIEILDNENKGESYRSVYRSRLVLTVSSTLGYESFFFGRNKKVLFLNYSGKAYDVECPDARFTLVDPSADYGAFRDRVDFLLGLELSGVPETARERHFAFDGRVQERIAEFLNREPRA